MNLLSFEATMSGSTSKRSASKNLLAIKVGERKHRRRGNAVPNADVMIVISYLRLEVDQHYAGKRPFVNTNSSINALQIERGAVSIRIVALSNGCFAIYPSEQRPKNARSLDEVLDLILDTIGEE